MARALDVESLAWLGIMLGSPDRSIWSLGYQSCGAGRQHQCRKGPPLFFFCRLYNWALDLNTRDGPSALFYSMLRLLFVTVVLSILICCFHLFWLVAGYRMRHERSSGTMFRSRIPQSAMACEYIKCMQVRRKPPRIQTPVTWLQSAQIVLCKELGSVVIRSALPNSSLGSIL